MGARLRLLETNQLLRLASDAFLFASAVFLLRLLDFNWLATIAFLVFTGLIFFRPALAINKFSVSILLLSSLVFLIPPISLGGIPWLFGEALLAVFFGLIIFLVLGSKNLVFLNRREWQALARFLLLIAFLATAFYGRLGEFTLPVSFVVFLALSVERTRQSNAEPAPMLKPAVSALGFTELLWAISLLPIGFIAETAFLAAPIFIFEDLLFTAERGAMSRRLIMENLTLLFILIFFVLSLSNWRPV